VTPDVSIMGDKTGKWIGEMDTDFEAYDHGHVRFHDGDGTNILPDLVLGNYSTTPVPRSDGEDDESNNTLVIWQPLTIT